MLPLASACSSRDHSLTLQVDLMSTEEIGKVEFYTGFVNCIVPILSQRLVSQAHYNDTCIIHYLICQMCC